MIFVKTCSNMYYLFRTHIYWYSAFWDYHINQRLWKQTTIMFAKDRVMDWRQTVPFPLSCENLPQLLWDILCSSLIIIRGCSQCASESVVLRVGQSDVSGGVRQAARWGSRQCRSAWWAPPPQDAAGCGWRRGWCPLLCLPREEGHIELLASSGSVVQ